MKGFCHFLLTPSCTSEHLGKRLKVGWKFHVIESHLVDFLKSHEYGLGVYAEQACEASHKAMKTTFKRFKSTGKEGNLRKTSMVFSSIRL